MTYISGQKKKKNWRLKLKCELVLKSATFCLIKTGKEVTLFSRRDQTDCRFAGFVEFVFLFLQLEGKETLKCYCVGQSLCEKVKYSE